MFYGQAMIKVFQIILLVLLSSVLAHADEATDTIASTIKAARHELDSAYEKLSEPKGNNKETLERVQKESRDNIFKLVFGKNGLGVTTNRLPGMIRIHVTYQGEKDSYDWTP